MVYIGVWDPYDLSVVAVSELDSSDLVVAIVHLTSGRLAFLKLMEVSWDGYVEIGGVQPSDIGCTWTLYLSLCQ